METSRSHRHCGRSCQCRSNQIQESSSSMFGTESGLSRPSSFSSSAVTTNFDGSMSTISTTTRKSFRDAAKEVGGSCINCFISCQCKEVQEEDAHEERAPQDISCISIPEGSIIQDNKIPTLRRYSINENPQGRTREFTMNEIQWATCNFSEANIIGEGSFGIVYKGKLKEGSNVAVKRAKQVVHGKKLEANVFRNEVQTLSKIDQYNLVRFLGYHEQGNEQIIVTEYVSNGNLRQHLDGSCGKTLQVAERLQIAIDIADGVSYLHTNTDHPIIHRDIKASNILITENRRAKVGDFGCALLVDDNLFKTHITTQIKGSIGYLDPEYLQTYQLTEKSDVYSFGVLLVELVTGRHPSEPARPSNELVTTIWAMKKLMEKQVSSVIDPRLQCQNPTHIMVMQLMLELARRCLAQSRCHRPLMKECSEFLWRIRRNSTNLESLTSSSSIRTVDNSREVRGEISSGVSNSENERPSWSCRRRRPVESWGWNSSSATVRDESWVRDYDEDAHSQIDSSWSSETELVHRRRRRSPTHWGRRPQHHRSRTRSHRSITRFCCIL